MDSHRLYTHHLDFVKRLLRRFGVRPTEVEDATQDAFERMHRLVGGFEGRAKIETWIYAVCWRVAAEYHRRPRDMRDHEVTEARVEALAELAPGGTLHDALGTLDSGDRELLVLHELGELSIYTLSELTGNARTTIRRRLERARAAVEQRFENRTNGTKAAAMRALKVRRSPRSVDEQALAELAQDCNAQEYICADYGVARHGHAVLAISHRITDTRYFAICTKLTLAAAQGREGFTYLCVIDPSSHMPDAEGRAIMTWLLRKTAERLRGVAFVVSETRPHVAAILNTIFFLSGRQTELRVFNQLDAGFEWFVQRTPNATLPGIRAHYERTRARMQASACPIEASSSSVAEA